MNLPWAYGELKKIARALEGTARDCCEVWETDEDEDSDTYGEEKKIADKDSMDRRDLEELREELLSLAKDVRVVLDNLADPVRGVQ